MSVLAGKTSTSEETDDMDATDGLQGDVKKIDATLDQPIEIHLWEDRTRGELWIPSYDPSALALLGDDYVRVAGNNAVDNGQRTFEFKAMKPGTFTIRVRETHGMEVYGRGPARISRRRFAKREGMIVPEMAFLNGRFLPLAEATVSIEDRGFQFGDGVYEVIRTYRGRPFKLDAHLARLDRSAKAIDLRQPYPSERWADYVTEGLRLAGFPEAKIYVQITRGTAPRDHAYAPDLQPTVLMTVRELQPLSPTIQAAGVAAMTMKDIRWGRCDIKSINLLANVLARQQAKVRGVFEAILVRDGQVTEGAVSNVFIVRDRNLITAPEGAWILSGVTRAVVLELARHEGLTVEERYCSEHELLGAAEVFLTGTTVEVLGVVRIDGKPIGGGEPGPGDAQFGQAVSRANPITGPLL